MILNLAANFFPLSKLVIVIIGWFVFMATFLFRKKPGNVEEKKRDKASTTGIVIQMVGFALVWSIRRPFLQPIGGGSVLLNTFLLLVTLVTVVGSLWMVIKAVQILGKQWSLGARLVKGHELIVEGPYRIVRNPIYAGMLGMLLATGIALSYWFIILLALPIFIYGTMIRIRSEESLLQSEFGQTYAEYAKRVPALLPALRTYRAEKA